MSGSNPIPVQIPGLAAASLPLGALDQLIVSQNGIAREVAIQDLFSTIVNPLVVPGITVTGDALIDGNLTIHGQINGQTGPFLPLAGETVTGATTFSATGTGLSVTNNLNIGGSLLIATNNAITMGTDANNPFMAIGKGAGALLTAGALWEFALGFGSLADDVNTGAGENVGLGPLTLNKLTTGTFNTAGGLHAGGHLLTDNNTTCFGNDAGRNFVGANSRTALGNDSGRSGGRVDALMFDTYIGFQTGRGNSGSITVGGTATNGDIISIIFTSAQLAGSPVTVPFTVTTGLTTAQIATGIMTAINASSLPAQGVSAGVDVINTSVLGVDFPGTSATGMSIAITSSISGAATETITTTGGFAGQDNVGVGNQSMYFSRASSASFNVGVGKFTLASLTTGGTNSAYGHATLPRLTTASRVTAAGALAGQNATTGDGNTLFGYQAGGTLTTGFSNTIIGQNVASTTLTTGAGNILIGVSSACDAAAAGTNDTLKIQGGGSTPVMSATAINATPLVLIPGSAQLAGAGNSLGFFGTTVAAKQTVTGSRGANAALASLLTALATYGLVVDSST